MAAMAALEERYESVFQMLVPISGLSPQRQQQLLAQAEILEFRSNDFVFREGDRDNFAFFLLDGRLELLAQGQLVKRVQGGSSDAVHPLAQLQPRQLSARANSGVTVLRLDRTLMDKLLAIDGADEIQQVQVSEIDAADDDADWMTRMLQSELFARVPAANIQRIFTRLESFSAKAGETIVEQDAAGDYYYIIQHGRCEVTRQTSTGKVPIKLAELGPGDSFGEEALVSNSRRNANVKMLTDGELMRLVKEDFVELIKTPLLSAIDFTEGKRLVAEENAKWIDVRFPEEHKNGAIGGSINQPLNTLRMHAERLERDRSYIVYCDSGSRSSVAAFLLSERGFDVYCLRGGLIEYGIVNAVDQRYTEADTACDDGNLEISSDANNDLPVTIAALVPSSHRSEVEQGPENLPRADTSDSLVEADVRAQALKAELARANLKLEEARRYKEQAEAAREQAASAAKETLEVERARLSEEARLAKQQVEEAERVKQELARAKEKAQEEARALAAQRAIEIEEANRQVEEARRLKKELAAAKRAAAEQARKAKEKEKAELEEANRQLEEARRLKKEAEAAKLEMDKQAEERLREEQEKLAEDARRAKAVLEEAQRIKEEVAREKELAEAEAEKARQEQQARFDDMQRQAEERMREEERKLAESYAWQAEELARLQKMKDEAEQELESERERLRAEASEAKNRLREAQRIQSEVEKTREESSREAEERQRRQVELERKLRDEVQEKIVSERHKIEAEFARNAEELERARREKEAAEAARAAAAEEAERIIAEYKNTHEQLREREQAKLEAERARLQQEAEALREALEESRHEREAALKLQRETEAQIEALANEKHIGAAEAQKLAEDIAVLEAEAREARETAEAAEEAQRKAQAAADANREFMEQNRTEESASRNRFEEEIAAWLEEQETHESSDMQQQILANQRAHLERIKLRAQSAREAAKLHDQSLIDELASRLREDESS